MRRPALSATSRPSWIEPDRPGRGLRWPTRSPRLLPRRVTLEHS